MFQIAKNPAETIFAQKPQGPYPKTIPEKSQPQPSPPKMGEMSLHFFFFTITRERYTF